MPASPITITPFTSDHLKDAAGLLAHRHRAERAHCPTLSAAFEAPPAALKALQAVWGRSGTAGVAALQDGQLIGYLLGYTLIDSLMGRTAWLHLAGHATAPTHTPALYHELYEALAAQWVKQGFFAHYVMVSAGNQAALGAWFGLGFGQQQAYGILALADYQPNPATSHALDIRQAVPADAEAVREIAVNNVVYQTQSPVFAATPPEELDDVREGYVELVENPDEGTLWLALRGGRVVGYQAYTSVEADDTHMLLPDAPCIELPAAGTIATERGAGVGRALTQHCFQWAQNAGTVYCLADWRTTNRLASRFWATVGFKPIAYRLERRLDPRIAWAQE